MILYIIGHIMPGISVTVASFPSHKDPPSLQSVSFPTKQCSPPSYWSSFYKVSLASLIQSP